MRKKTGPVRAVCRLWAGRPACEAPIATGRDPGPMRALCQTAAGATPTDAACNRAASRRDHAAAPKLLLAELLVVQLAEYPAPRDQILRRSLFHGLPLIDDNDLVGPQNG